MKRFAAAWVIVWVLFSSMSLAESSSNQAVPIASDDYALRPILSMQSQVVEVAPQAQRAPMEAPLPAAFWQGFACLIMLLVSWRVCRTVALR